MPKKSSKTAHVLNLLTTGEEQDNVSASAPAPGPVPEAVKEAAPSRGRRGTDHIASEMVLASGGKIKIENETFNPLSDILREELEKQFVPFSADAKSETSGDALLRGKKKDEEMKSMNEPAAKLQDSEYIAVNIVEDIVKTKAKGFMERLGGCMCDRCINDAIALTLNSLPPQYTVTLKGMLFAKVVSYENQHTTDITTALTKACLQVKARPRH